MSLLSALLFMYLVIAFAVTLGLINKPELKDVLASAIVGLVWPISLPIKIHKHNKGA